MVIRPMDYPVPDQDITQRMRKNRSPARMRRSGGRGMKVWLVL